MHKHTLTELKALLDGGKVSARELTDTFLARIESLDGELNSFVTVTTEQARLEADAADAARSKGEAGLLNGLPIAHKDIFCTDGVRTSCGSRMLDNFISPYDATVVKKMRAAGAIMLGKTNMDEFAMGSSNETSFYGPVKNPWDLSRVPGGSSGGSAAAVAARLAPAATGTDTGGSIRQPAALTGITGLKPTYGTVSRWGMIAFASSLDQAGPMAQSAADCALMLQTMVGHDVKDSTSLDRTADDYLADLDKPLAGLTVGLPEEFFPASLDGRIAELTRETARELERQGAKVVSVSLPSVKLSVPAYYVIAPAEASSNLSRFDGVRYGYRCQDPVDLMDLYKRSRSEGFGDEVQRRILVGTYALSHGYYDAYYLRAQKVRRLISDDFARAFEKADVILGPTSPEVAFQLGAKKDDPVTMYMADVFTIAVNLAGLPALSMPGGAIDGLPVGVQLIGNYFREGQILNVAHRYQQATDWHRQAPAFGGDK
ncbi:Asp-tRNA(Asn)/Glu-tRNA(Gln) amidotransferase subunit GatA [Alcanivorax sp. 1008]|uniref:Asp-tRNA(Asn)/Glu-tRNA(Gln) amidotransferase subunit GatA n=1 Tax=Alcanivorax sp. 1008 TaxID=2816853 RepID=UPI001D22182A|nr:Asp-tRNA(Asn)/Glu-tRNA(Gln) amidotransferase subunit GatA [Alcanivorax sp. 1008]MCC1495204.1 Asp-tRNA(Asn)/Glu-tRNA(Gln) amidotransferase subunit GatA [Alcanivorax sp. 1008]